MDIKSKHDENITVKIINMPTNELADRNVELRFINIEHHINYKDSKWKLCK